MGSATIQLVVFSVDGRKLALRLAAVSRVVRAAQVCPVRNAPPVVVGLLDVQGEVLPVLDLRARLGLPCRPIGVDDQFMIVHSPLRTLALVVQSVHGLVEAQLRETWEPWLQRFDGLAQTADGLLLIEDIETFLSAAENEQLERALEATG